MAANTVTRTEKIIDFHINELRKLGYDPAKRIAALTTLLERTYDALEDVLLCVQVLQPTRYNDKAANVQDALSRITRTLAHVSFTSDDADTEPITPLPLADERDSRNAFYDGRLIDSEVGVYRLRYAGNEYLDITGDE